MRIKSQRDFFAGLLFIVLGLAFAIRMPLHAAARGAVPAPAFVLVLSLLLVLLGAAVLFKSLTIETEGGHRIGAIAWRPLLLVLFAVAFFGFGLNTLGLLLAAAGLVLMIGLAESGFSASALLLNVLVLTPLCWWVGVRWLGLALPLWPGAH